jgi:hypothetical protein
LYKPDTLDFTFVEEAKWVKHIRKLTKAIDFMEKSSNLKTKLSEILPLHQLSSHLKIIFV